MSSVIRIRCILNGLWQVRNDGGVDGGIELDRFSGYQIISGGVGRRLERRDIVRLVSWVMNNLSWRREAALMAEHS